MGVWESQQGEIPKQDEIVDKWLIEGHNIFAFKADYLVIQPTVRGWMVDGTQKACRTKPKAPRKFKQQIDEGGVNSRSNERVLVRFSHSQYGFGFRIL